MNHNVDDYAKWFSNASFYLGITLIVVSFISVIIGKITPPYTSLPFIRASFFWVISSWGFLTSIVNIWIVDKLNKNKTTKCIEQYIITSAYFLILLVTFYFKSKYRDYYGNINVFVSNLIMLTWFYLITIFLSVYNNNASIRKQLYIFTCSVLLSLLIIYGFCRINYYRGMINLHTSVFLPSVYSGNFKVAASTLVVFMLFIFLALMLPFHQKENIFYFSFLYKDGKRVHLRRPQVTAALIAFTGVLLGLSFEIFKWVREEYKKEANIEIVDLFADDINKVPILLDVKVNNVGEKTAYLKKAELYVTKAWTFKKKIKLLPQNIRVEHIEFSDIYDVDLSTKGIPYADTINLSQSVPGNGVDRIGIKIGTKCIFDSLQPEVPKKFKILFYDISKPKNNDIHKIHCLDFYAFELKIKLIYNKSNKYVESKPIIFVIQPPWGELGFEELRGENENNLFKEISQREAIKSKGIVKLIQGQNK